MRCYHLNNMYMSAIQQGIQSAHAQMELFVKYTPVFKEDHGMSTDEQFPKELQEQAMKSKMLYDWAINHKTMIVLNGGFFSDMQLALEFFNDDRNPYPVAEFYESKEAMNGMLTNIAIVLPEKIYKMSEFIRQRIVDNEGKLIPDVTGYDEIQKTIDDFGEYSEYELELCKFMNQFRLA